MSKPKNIDLGLTSNDREMIDAVVDGHYEVHGSAVKGDLHGSLYAAGKMSLQKQIIFKVQDTKGESHAVYGDDFAAHALQDIIHKLNEIESKEANKS